MQPSRPIQAVPPDERRLEICILEENLFKISTASSGYSTNKSSAGFWPEELAVFHKNPFSIRYAMKYREGNFSNA